MIGSISKQGEYFWLAFIIFIIVAALLYYGIVRNTTDGKTRKVLLSPRVWMLLGFTVFAVGGFISGAPCWHALIAILILELIVALVRACRNGNWRRFNDCDTGCPTSINQSNNNSGSNVSNRSGWFGRGSYGFGDGDCFDWRQCLFRIFWDIVGFLFGACFLREAQLEKGLYSYCGLYKLWWVHAILVLLFFGLLWQVGWQNAKRQAACVMLNKRVWVIVQAVLFLFLGMVSGAPWYYGLLLIVAFEILEWGLRWSFPYFCKSWRYAGYVILWTLLAYMVGVYIVRYFELPAGAYSAGRRLGVHF